MARCVILCAGGFDGLVEPLGQGDYLIAADGGVAYAKALGLTPHCVLGDFDSLGYTPEGAHVFPVEKDDTDAMLAVRQGLAQGCREFVIYGCLDGPRLDHTVAALQTLRFLYDRGAVGALVGLREIVTGVKDGSLALPEQARGVVSVFCLGEAARGVDIRGLYYGMENGELTAGFPLGVSNHFTGQPARISVKAGSLTVFYGRENGLPSWKE